MRVCISNRFEEKIFERQCRRIALPRERQNRTTALSEVKKEKGIIRLTRSINSTTRCSRKRRSGKGTKNVSPESPLTLQSFRGDVNDNVRSHVDPAEEEYERAKYEEEVIKERIRDRESYEKTGKIKSVGTPKKSSLYSHATTTQRGGGNGGGQRINGNKMTQEELEKLTLEDLAIDSDPEDDVENNNSARQQQIQQRKRTNARASSISLPCYRTIDKVETRVNALEQIRGVPMDDLSAPPRRQGSITREKRFNSPKKKR